MEEGYIRFFSSYIVANPMNFVAIFLLSLMRIAPIFSLAPFLAAKVSPGPIRMGLVMSFSLLILPLIMMRTQTEFSFDGFFMGIAAKEIMIGLVIGFIVTVPFLIVQSTGILIDFLRGSSIFQAQDPTTQASSSPIGILYNYILIVLFFELSGPQLFFSALQQSYIYIPLDSFIPASFFSPGLPFWKSMMQLLNTIMSVSIQISAPSMLAILMAEVFLGIANRLAPQVQIAFLGMSLKSFMGLLLMLFSWPLVLQVMGKMGISWMEKLSDWLLQMSLLLQKSS